MSWEQLKDKLRTALDDEISTKDRSIVFRIVVGILIIINFSCILYCILANSFLK